MTTHFYSNSSAPTPVSPATPLPVSPYGADRASMWRYAAALNGITNTTVAVTIASAAGAGIRNYITGIQISATALTTATQIAIRDGAGGTVIWRANLTTAALPITNIKFDVPLVGTANTLLEVVTLTASGTGNFYFNAQGFTAP